MFDPENTMDKEEMNKLLVEIMNYPSTDLAEIHANALKLGNYDLKKPPP